MYLYLLLFFIFVLAIELTLIIIAIKLIIYLSSVEKTIPVYEEQFKSEIKLIRDEFKSLNCTISMQNTKSINYYELGKMCSEILMKLLIFKKLTLMNFLTILINYRKQLVSLLAYCKTIER